MFVIGVGGVGVLGNELSLLLVFSILRQLLCIMIREELIRYL